jgi:DNA-binding Lrp family transcriptional regulator
MPDAALSPNPSPAGGRGERCEPPARLDELDRRLIVATQGGLPLVPRPYHALAGQLGTSAEEVMARIGRLLESGVIRRIGAVPNHYAIGYTANGMSVWDVPDERIDALGELVGKLPFVTHCYHRPRHLPLWPYNLFAMVHGRSREEVAAQVKEIASLLGEACHSHDILFSSRILKKTGLRLAG